MPRGKRRTPKKASVSKDSESAVEDVPEDANQEAEEKIEESSVKEELSDNLKEETIPADDVEEQNENAEGDDYEAQDEAENMEEAEEENEEEKTEEPEMDEAKNEQAKKPLSVEDWPVTPHAPHKMPVVMNNKLKEKWEWHMRIYPIDQSDIRRCVLDSVSKIAQETWFYIDKSNYGMGAYDLCMRTCTDAAMVMLKTLRAQMMYRYVTVEVTKRGKNPAEVQKIKDNPPPLVKTEKTSEESSEDLEDGVEEAIEALPYTEILETATLHLDYMHTLECDKVKGKEKKRSLYVKYLPEHTSKELLKVLFPVAINLDIISTGAGRRVGELDVVTMENLYGIVQAYVTVYINDCKTITFNWDKDDLDHGKVAEVTKKESPWELLPRDYETHYEAVPEVEEDESVQYRKRKREMDMQHKRAMENHARRREDRRRGGKDTHAAHELMHLQMSMNAKIQSQLALLHAVDGPPPLMGLDTEMMMDPAMMRDRKRDRFERDRMEMEMSRRMPGNFPPYEMDRGGRMGMSERDMRGHGGFMSPRDRERNFYEGGPGRGGGFGGRGRFEGDRQWNREGDRGRGGRRQDGSGRSRPSRFDAPRERFDSSGSGGQSQDGAAQQSSDDARGSARGGMNNATGGMGRGAPNSKGSEAGGQDANQRYGGRGNSKGKPVTHGFPSNQEQSGDNQRSQNQYPNRSAGGEDAANQQKQGSFGNRGGFNNRGGFGSDRQDSGGNRFQNQNRGFGFQNNQGGFRQQNQQGNFGSGQNQSGNYGQNRQGPGGLGSPQNRQSSFGNQGQQRGFGSNQNRQGGFGGNQNQQGRYGGNQNQGGFGGNQNQGFGGNQNQGGYGGNQNQGGYGGNQNQGGYGGNQNQGGYGGNQNQGGYGGNQNQGFGGNQNQQGGYGANQSQQAGYGGYQQSSFGSGAGQQNSYSTMGNQGSNYGPVGSQPSSYGSSGNQQTGYGSTNQQAAYGTNQQGNYGSAQGNQQSGYGNMQSQNYGNQQSYSTQQASYGSYNTMQQQDQSYSTQQQQQTGYSTGTTYDWSQQSGTANYSQGYGGQVNQQQQQPQQQQQQQQQQQDFSAYSTAYPGFTTNNPSAASGYGADSAFANQGLYNATQSSESYGTYEGYGTTTQQSSVGGYNYGQYQASS